MTHPIFQNYFNDQAKALYNDLVAESIEVGGKDCYYLPRVIAAQDKIMNEVFLSKYKEAYKISVFREEAGGFRPNDFMIGKFGPEFGGNETTFAVSKFKFKEITGQDYPTNGGILVFTDVKQIYEIRDVDTRDPWISGGKIYYWKMQCMPFEYGKNTSISTDIMDFLDMDTETLIETLVEENDIFESNYFTADSTCIFADTTKHLASEMLESETFWPITADRTDVYASDMDWTVDIDLKPWTPNSSLMDKGDANNKNANNSCFRKEAKKFDVTNIFGFE